MTERARTSDGGGDGDGDGSGENTVDTLRARAAARDGGSRETGSQRNLSPQQQANVQALKSDLQTLGQGAKNAEDEIRQLAASLQSMAVTAPDPALVEALATDLYAALDDGALSPREAASLASSLEAVLASAGLDAQEVHVLIDDVEDVLQAAGVGRAELQAVVRDLQAIAAEAQGAAAGGGRLGAARRGLRGGG